MQWSYREKYGEKIVKVKAHFGWTGFEGVFIHNFGIHASLLAPGL